METITIHIGEFGLPSEMILVVPAGYAFLPLNGGLAVYHV